MEMNATVDEERRKNFRAFSKAMLDASKGLRPGETATFTCPVCGSSAMVGLVPGGRIGGCSRDGCFKFI